ncbi:MAG: ribonuclease Z [Candidatus Woesearchaeota archaeon]
MEITFLGTSCMVPTKERNHQSIFLFYKGEGILIDCGEGTQRQMKIADIKFSKINKILISHWHGDHVLGLPGLLQSINASGYEGKLLIYGPKETKERFFFMTKAFSFNLNFDYEIIELKNKDVIESRDLIIETRELEHGIPCLGYSIKEKDIRKIRLNFVRKLGIPDGPLLGELQNNKEIIWEGKKIHPDEATYIVKGKKVSIILDTNFCNNALELAKDSDLLISESVYPDELYNKAEEYKHMTAKNAAYLASKSNSKKLILTHFSQRFKTIENILDEAKEIFPETYASYDLMKVKV